MSCRLFAWARMGLAGLLASALLACTVNPPKDATTVRPAREGIAHFELNGRMAITQGEHSNTVRVHWEHTASADLVRFAGPLGNTLAELRRDSSGAHWTGSDGSTYEAANTDELLVHLTDISIPLDRLSRWVLGLPDTQMPFQNDTLGRMLSSTDNGWTVHINRYENEAPSALPTLLDAEGHGLRIRLAIEDWQL